MSPHEADRKFQSFSGRRSLSGEAQGLDGDAFARAISLALRAEYGDTHGAVKIVARLTGANLRSVRNWLEGKNAPNGRSLVALCRHSDRVFETVLRLSGRERLLKAKKLIDARQKLREIVSLLDQMEAGASADGPAIWPTTPWPGEPVTAR